MKNLIDVVILSERLKLLPLSAEYAEDIFRELTDEITIYMNPKTPERLEETLSYIESAQKKILSGTDLPVVILDKQTGEFLGGGGVHKLDTDTPEFGIWIKKNAHGNKYGREAVTVLKKWVDKNIKYEYLVYPADRRNLASRKIAESLGGVIKAEYKKPNAAGRVLDEVEYRIYPNQIAED